MTRYEFTYNQEIGHQGQSLVPHFPGGDSGVTIGPGYDMGGRSPEEIYADLTRVGVDTEIAQVLAQAAYKTGDDASRWISQHGGLYITEEQQRALYEEVLVPEYEQRMQSQLIHFAENHESITPDMVEVDHLSARQKHILFDYTYNAGLSKFPTLVEAVLREDWDEVSRHYERFSAGEPLFYRNEMFYQTFLDPEAVDQFEKSVEINREIIAIEGMLDDIAANDIEEDAQRLQDEDSRLSAD
ncbi:hypothetical protein DR864_28345 (plasmid) [Runella rosea]|uniref:Pesticin C-terminal domain-containing protein n=1 Tax=Runella rosea TaxID=2259595 RepID=A0A344TT16_9BACT|nr:pesticin C-terminus-like muramidase [Runella rosea]AXE21787.1 hypothetical protein DR864_28345 [Runella rosea]